VLGERSPLGRAAALLARCPPPTTSNLDLLCGADRHPRLKSEVCCDGGINSRVRCASPGGACARTGVQVQANNGADTPANSSTKLKESLLTQLRGLYRLGELLGVGLRSTVGDAAAGHVVLGGWVGFDWLGGCSSG
jgi:hypothetical protein